MAKLIILAALACLAFQQDIRATQYAYRVDFANKNHSPTTADSLSFLSLRSLSRRAAQGILLDSTDLPVSSVYVDSILHVTGGKLHEVSKWLNLCVILVNDSTSIRALNGISFIRSTKLVGYYSGTLHRPTRKDTVAFPAPAAKTTNDAAYYGNTWNQTNLVNGNFLHDLGFFGAGRLIAVIDAGYSGVDTHVGFDSLRNSNRIADKHNFTLASDNVYNYDDHGTSSLSTMAGYSPGTYVGTAPQAAYALYITEDGGSEQPIELLNLLCAAERADSIGADIITSSLGYNTFDDPTENLVFGRDCDGKTTPAAVAANMATKKGMLFVASAGNEGGDSWNNILTPSDADSALTIGSVNDAGTVVSTSGYGPNAAGRIKPDVCGQGHFAATFSTTGFVSRDGTSFSTPQIAGWAACLWQAVPWATPASLRYAITSCADHYTAPGVQYGYGIPNFECTANALHILSTHIPVPGDFTLTVVNPVTVELPIYITLPSAQNVALTIMDITGRRLSQFSAALQAGSNATINYPVAHLPTGIYIVTAEAAGLRKVLKFVKE